MQVGQIANFQIDFVRVRGDESWDDLQRRIYQGVIPYQSTEVAEREVVSHLSEEIRYSGPRTVIEDYDMSCIQQPGSISFEASGQIEALLYAHPWSGLVDIRYGNRSMRVDLYAEHAVFPRSVDLDLGPKTQRVEITPTGEKNALSSGAQCLFGGFQRQTGRSISLRHRKERKVRGAQFTGEFDRLLSTVPADGLLLDLGGGNRQIDDSRYLNVDYAKYPEPDLIADATRLPLRDASIDVVYSSGVFEHINDPGKAGAEVARVLKPGGKAVIGWAFMQPIHSEGQHFYNATPWGVERAFLGLKVERMWYDTSFESLVRWGASASGLDGLTSPDEMEAVCATLKKWDALIPESRKAYMANGIWCEFEKV